MQLLECLSNYNQNLFNMVIQRQIAKGQRILVTKDAQKWRKENEISLILQSDLNFSYLALDLELLA